ncbi:MAG: alginate lyase family protein, partial [Chloroflexi bacterium]|nr:alginate lyase family protein [Chloroflexota bacterium]
QRLITDWLAAHPIDASDAWHPFVVSERLMAWLVVRDLLPELGAGLRQPILLHAVYLDRHLEHDVGGNHLLKNLVALLEAGCAFDGPAPTAWRQRASSGLGRELRRQVLPDGGHYERSPMYHLLVLADLLAALFPAGRRELPISVDLARAVRGMQSVATTLVHPDGEIPLFNDSVLDEAPHPSELIGPSTEPTGPCLPWTGYAVLRAGEGVLIADCGAPGPDDLPAHVHADALSFELSIGSQRVLVDGGVFDYNAGPLRDRLRGTASHNTVGIDGADQTEVWGAFRVGRRARVTLSRCSDRLLVAEHDGYARLGVRHERRIDAVDGVGWRVLDTLTGRGAHVADARLRLHPSLHWQANSERWLACDASGRVLLQVRPIGRPVVTLERGIYAERFNQLQDVQVLRMQREGDLPHVFGCWLLLPGAEPVVV